MKPTPLPDVAELPDSALVYRCIGILKNVYPRKSGESAKGPWALQNLELADSNGFTLPVVLKDHDSEVPKTWKGREVMLEAYQGEKAWSGCYAFDDDYNGKVTRKLKLTKTGQVSLVEGGERPAAAQQPHAQQKPAGGTTAAQGQPKSEGKPNEQPSKEETEKQQREKLTAATRCAIQLANLQLLSLNLTETYTAPRFEKVAGRKLTEVEKHAWAMNMAIELEREKQQFRMPDRKLLDPKQTPVETPKTYAGKPWPAGAVPHPQTGEPVDLAGNPVSQ